MATTIVTKNGSGAPAASDLVAGELAVDLTNGRLYTEDSGGSVIEIGLNPSGNVDVTGTVTADSLEVDDTDDIRLRFLNASTFKGGLQIATTAGDMIATSAVDDLAIRSQSDILFATGGNTERMKIVDTGIDVTGTVTTDGLTSAGDVAITGGSSGSTVLTLTTNALADTPLMVFQRTGGAIAGKLAYEDGNTAMAFGTTTAHELKFLTGNTERMQIDSVGTTSIKTDGTTQLILNRADASIQATNQVAQILVTGDDPSASQSGAAISFIAGDAWATNSYPTNITFSNDLSGTLTERMRIDASGNLLVGSTSDSGTDYHYLKSDGFVRHKRDGGIVGVFDRGASDGDIVTFRKDGTTVGSIGAVSGDIVVGTGDTGLRFYDAGRAIQPRHTDGTAANDVIDLGMSANRFKDLYLSGNATHGTTPSSSAAGAFTEAVGRTTYSSGSGTGGFSNLKFINGNGTVGTVTTSGSATAYNTSSDYRLKENVVAMSGATERLKQLKPSRFNFIADADTTVDGFLAHEVQDIVPEAISGTKDAVDADGNPEYQGIDQSKLVPLLVATIQELEARIAALES
jgi:hypothetical protein